MRLNIARVIKSFLAHKPRKGDSKNTCSTDGHTIYSYAMPIAYRDDAGCVIVVPQASGLSRATKSQIAALRLAFNCDSDGVSGPPITWNMGFVERVAKGRITIAATQHFWSGRNFNP
jgi:hypothetical protein